MRPARSSILFALVALLLVLPTTAIAQGAGEPEMMEDPIEAMEPEVNVGDPVDPVDPAGDDITVQGDDVPVAQGIADGAVADDTQILESGAAVAPTSSPVASGTGQLPFTGLDSGRLMQLFLVGSVLLAGGIVSLAWAGARTEMA